MSVLNNTQGGSAEAEFDYIIIGGGTAGLTVAARLSEDASVRVLVVEAGGDHSEDPLTLTPGLLAGLYGKSEYDWNFTSVPQVTSPSSIYTEFFAMNRYQHFMTIADPQGPIDEPVPGKGPGR